MFQVDDDDEAMNSSDEALCDMLGLNSSEFCFQEVTEHDDNDDINTIRTLSQFGIPQFSVAEMAQCLKESNLSQVYRDESVCNVPPRLSVPAVTMRRLTDDLIWGDVTKTRANRTYETIYVWKRGVTEERRTLTRFEDFVNHHEGWRELCQSYLQKIVSLIAGTEMVLYKEKLNLKPAGGSGFAPHLDTPSLRVSLRGKGPQTFVTVMVAIDNMTIDNGCLRVCKGPWSENNSCEVIVPQEDGNPDAGGRAGAIPDHVAETLDFQEIVCRGGDIVLFNGWAPHRSAANQSPFSRRAVFLTYNAKDEGDFHNRYYDRMEEKRNEWRARVGLTSDGQLSADEQNELNALATIPRI